jgi:hypothetical protein
LARLLQGDDVAAEKDFEQCLKELKPLFDEYRKKIKQQPVAE